MKHYSFFATTSDCKVSELSIGRIIIVNHSLNPVVLESKSELDCLCGLFALNIVDTSEQLSPDFKQVFMLNQAKYFAQNEFDVLYSEWIKLTERENHMDEYGQLIFLTDISFYNKPFKYLLEE